MPTEEFVVLANSDKPGGRCVAGISTVSGEWVRPVSSRLSTGALSSRDCRVDGRMVRAFDVVRFGYERRLDDPAQPENVLIDGSDWTLTGDIAAGDAYEFLRPHIVAGPELLGDTEDSIDDSVAQDGVEASLAVIEPDAIEFRSRPPFNPGKRRRARALIELSGQDYDLSITDEVVAPVVRSAETGVYAPAELDLPESGHTVLTASLAEGWNGRHYKLAAAVLFLP